MVAAGDDSITTGAGKDSILGGDGNDTIHSGGGNDTILGGERRRQPRWRRWQRSHAITAFGAVAGNEGSTDNDTLGGTGNDKIYGDTGDDTLLGRRRQGHARTAATRYGDYLSGGKGDDSIVGGAGDDTIHGGAGNDSHLRWAGQ